MFKRIFTNTFFRMIALIKPREISYFGSIILQVSLYTLISVNEAIAIKSITNALIKKDMHSLTVSLIIFIFVILVIITIHPFVNWRYNINSKLIIAKLRSFFFKKLLRLPLLYFEKKHSGDIISRMNNDAFAMEEIYGNKLARFIRPIIRLVILITTMLIINWKAGLIFIIINFFYTYINVSFAKPLREISKKYFQNMSKLTEKAVDFIAGYNTIKIFNLHKLLMKSYTKASDDVADNFVMRHKTEGKLDSTNFFIRMLNTVGMIIAGTIMVMKNITDFGSLLALINLQTNLNQTILWAAQTMPLLQDALVGGGRLLEFVDEAPEQDNEAPGTSATEINSIVLKNINFGYSKEKKVLYDINISINKGEVIAIIGPSGCGKSTLLKILLGFYAPESGSILLNNILYRNFSLKNIRDLMAYVPQEPHLFNATIAENIIYGKSLASDDEIVFAAKNAYAHDFISSFPESYNTMVRDGGASLSGGERQRIAVARAMIRNPSILLLDEATSSLDSRSETLLQKALNKFVKNRTTIIVAHRLSTIRNADRIYVINNGRIIDSGKYKDIRKNIKFYLSNNFIK